jgi:hypothetical protein
MLLSIIQISFLTPKDAELLYFYHVCPGESIRSIRSIRSAASINCRTRRNYKIRKLDFVSASCRPIRAGLGTHNRSPQ